MSLVYVELEVETRAGDPAQHLIESDRTNRFTLQTTDTTYTTDLPAFSTTVYNFYTAELGTANVSNAEVRYKVDVGGVVQATGMDAGAEGGAVERAEGVLQTPSAATDITNQVTFIIGRLISDAQPRNF